VISDEQERPRGQQGDAGEGTSPAIPGSEGNIKGSSPPLKERSEDAGAVPAASTRNSSKWQVMSDEQERPRGDLS